jgi:catechol 2,3-dioxygenase-like lactoylglutathione lyase family enzyme
MNRFHVHLHVADIAQSVAFYSKLFAAEPARVEVDYAKWMLVDPPVNFAISTRGDKPGIDHLGIQTDNADDLAALKARAEAADMALFDEGQTSCCYSRSDKHWVTDPQGIAWEHFHTLASIPLFNESTDAVDSPTACCAPSSTNGAAAAEPAVAACCQPTTRGKPVGIAVKSAPSCC